MAYDGSMNINACRLLLCLVLALVAPEVQAAPPPASAQPVSLADALAAMPDASVADGSVILTVRPSKVLPVPEPLSPASHDAPPMDALPIDIPQAAEVLAPEDAVQTPDTLAARYGRSLQVFSHVLALAPPTMAVLNTDPSLAALPLGRLAGQHPETYLLGSLTAAQLRQAGTTGLAYADMTPDQQSLLHALLPEPLEIVPTALSEDKMDKAQRAAYDAQIKTLSGDALFGALRLHLYLTAHFYVHAPVGYGIGDTRELTPSTGAYKLPFSGYANMDTRGKSTESILKADVPNVPKFSDLTWNRRDLERAISLQGLTTVDALVQRIGSAVHLELYADPHYGPLPVLARGELRTRQPAGDVMQALALCVCGTWRQVGPAYVLTDDVQGLGTRQENLNEIAQIWSNRLSEAGREAGKQLGALDWLHSLSFVSGDIGALSPGQIDVIHKESGTNTGHLPWKALPPALQEHLKDVFLHYGDDLPKRVPTSAAALMDEMTKMGDAMKSAAESTTPNTPVEATINIRSAIELPNTGAMMLWDEYRVQPPKPDDAAAVKPDTSAPAGSIVVDKPLRGVLCAPRTAEEAQAVVAKLVEMKMNTLFVDVFTGGRTFFPNNALPPASPEASGVLAAALSAAKPQHIAVYAVMDTLCWRKDGLSPHPLSWPSGYLEDLTVTGETPDRVVQRRYAAGSLSLIYDNPHHLLARQGTERWASPLDPAVRGLLPVLTRTLAATPGLAGLIFQDTLPPGYAEDHMLENLSLGYTPGSRLAYLRQTHRDPIDLSSGFGDMVAVNVSEEDFFETYWITIPAFASDRTDYLAWVKRLRDEDLSLVNDCRQSARAAAPLLPLLVRSEWSSVASFDPWVDPVPRNPASQESTALRPSDQLTSRSILGVVYGPDELTHLESFVQNAEIGTAQGWGHQAGGEVFDLVTGGSPEHLLDRLEKLGGLLKKP